LTGALCLSLALGGAPALGEDAQAASPSAPPQPSEILEDPAAVTDAAAGEDEDAIRYTAVATTALKVRREPDADAAGNGSIERDDIVYTHRDGRRV
jgi:hypothetical protein